MGTPGLDGHLQQAEALPHGNPLDQADRGHRIRMVARHREYAALTVGQHALAQWRVEHLEAGRPLAHHQRQIGLAGFAGAELVLQMFKGAALLGHQQDATGFAIQPVHQFQEARLRPRHAQLFNDAKTDAGAAMHGHAGWLAHCHPAFFFLQYDKLADHAGLAPRGDLHGLRLVGGALRSAHRRQPHDVALDQPAFGAGPALVYAYFAAADDAVDMGLGNALELAHQVVVEALTRVVRLHQQGLRRGGPSRIIDPYNVFHQRRAASG